MATKKYKVDILSQSSIGRLIKDLQAYQNDLPNKTRLLAQRLAERGIVVAGARIGQSPLGKHVTIRTEISEDVVGTRAILIAVGDVIESEGYEPFNTLLAIEFGAGVYYNEKENPKGPEFGYGPGTFPGQIHAFDDGWYYWDEVAQTWKYTHGVKATMPMYSASVAILQDAVRIAKEVFA